MPVSTFELHCNHWGDSFPTWQHWTLSHMNPETQSGFTGSCQYIAWVPNRPEVGRRLWIPGWSGFNWIDSCYMPDTLLKAQDTAVKKAERLQTPDPDVLVTKDKRHTRNTSQIPSGMRDNYGGDLKDESALQYTAGWPTFHRGPILLTF